MIFFVLGGGAIYAVDIVNNVSIIEILWMLKHGYMDQRKNEKLYKWNLLILVEDESKQ